MKPYWQEDKNKKTLVQPQDKMDLDDILNQHKATDVDNMSDISDRSRASNISHASSVMKVEQRQAALEARAAALEREGQINRAKKETQLQAKALMERLELSLIDLDLQEKKLKLETELKACDAERRVLKKYEEGNGFSREVSPRRGPVISTPHTQPQENNESTDQPTRGYSHGQPHMLTTPVYSQNTGDHRQHRQAVSMIPVWQERQQQYGSRPPPQDARTETSHDLGGMVRQHDQGYTYVPPIIQPPSTYIESTAMLTTALESLVDKINSKSELPKVSPEKFGGDLFTYPYWKQSFYAIIDDNATTVAQKLVHLSRSTTGEAHEAIKGLLSLNTQDAYDQAMALLERRYGDPFLVAQACKEKIMNWPAIKSGQGRELRKFSDHLQYCLVAMNTIQYMEYLNSQDANSLILTKLPRDIVGKWCRRIHKAVKTEQRFPLFSEFCSFIEDQADTTCTAENMLGKIEKSTHSVPGNKNSDRRHDQGARPKQKTAVRALATSAHDDEESATVTVHNTQQKSQLSDSRNKCWQCQKEHLLEVCDQFQAMTVTERREFLKKKGLCYGCINRRHKIQQCYQRKQCETCQGLHPTLLHNDRPKPDSHGNDSNGATVTAHATVCANMASNEEASPVYDSKINSMIVPVVLGHKDTPGDNVTVYAVLDNQSNGCFIDTSIMKQLKVAGRAVDLRLSTLTGEDSIKSIAVQDLVVKGTSEHCPSIQLPTTYTRDSIPVDRSMIPSRAIAEQWSHLSTIIDDMRSPDDDTPIGLLIGLNCPRALKPRDFKLGGGDEPWAVRTLLGWGICGIVQNDSHDKPCHFVHGTRVAEVSPSEIVSMYDVDFHERKGDDKVSVEDKRFINMMKDNIERRDGHFELPLPFKKDLKLPNNRDQALKRLEQLKRKMQRNDQFHTDYIDFMNSLIEHKYAERVPADELQLDNGRVWYIPHHGVYHPKKLKIRIVFDCSAQYRGEVLNRHLLQGPDLINNMIGVLCRFRQEQIAVACDVEGMFHQVGVTEKDRNYLRFLWFEDGDLDKRPIDFRMAVHLFGATSSPGCANFALKTAADSFEDECGSPAADFIRRNFYVDDGLISVKTPAEALQLIEHTRELCQKGGFNLHKFICNDKNVLEAIPVQLRAKEVQNLNLPSDSLPMERTLGVHWCVESDTFQFRIEVQDKPLTRRGILSTISSVFDPLGFVAPFVLMGKQVLQELVRDGGDWDDPIPEDIQTKWERWCSELTDLKNIQVPRCLKGDSSQVAKCEMHHFSDASMSGYGQCSYVRFTDSDGNTSSHLVMAKARVAPSKPMTIPRMELTAAVVSVKVAHFLQKELDYKDVAHYYWTDSKVVIGYVNNEAKRFHIFVANRIQQIRDHTEVTAWHHIDTRQNPADLASRGVNVRDLADSDLWWHGPAFLSSSEDLPVTNEAPTVQITDPEVKRVVHETSVEVAFSNLLERLEYYSDWHRAKRAVALCCRYIGILKSRIDKKRQGAKLTDHDQNDRSYSPVTVAELQGAEKIIIMAAQRESFQKELLSLCESPSYSSDRKQCRARNTEIKKNSSLYRIDPYIGNDGLLRVGGRIRRANVPRDLAHPVILPKDGHITHLIIDHHHRETHHSGRGITLNQLRASGYWIIKARVKVTSYIWHCVKCRKIRAGTLTQKMADLPADRINPADPFTYSAVDYFGPFYIKEGRSQRKRWGVLFTCMSSRAVHLETANSLSTDSFINAYRRFVGRRGIVRQLRSDRGTNFVGARSEMESALSEMDDDRLSKELLKEGCDYVTFKMNPPHASHMGGSWERMIRSVRSVLSALMDTHGDYLDDEQLRTFMTEAESIVNSRPLTYVDTSSPDSKEPLSPSQILTFKSKVVLPPPGVFMKEDVYCRKRWRRVQFLANQFWDRWRKEYLVYLMERQKWQKPAVNLEVGDIVLVTDSCVPRSQWPVARVIDVLRSGDELVRQATLRLGQSTYTRPVHKLVLLLRPGNPVEEPTE